MLKIISKTKETNASEFLFKKDRMIVITNHCNLNCGGCSQLIGQFTKNQLWNITLEDLEKSIQLLKKNPSKHPITIFGGEPTLHPQWNEIVKLLKSHTPTNFKITTNGRLGHGKFSNNRYQKEDNLIYWIDTHPESQLFVQTLFAAKDAIVLKNDLAYWEKAQKDCPVWLRCPSPIYKGKAYFCGIAGAIDWLYNDGKNGWEIKPNKNPFDKTTEEINRQAEHICKRCGWCVPELIPRQLSKEPTNVSPYNQIDSMKKKFSLPVIEPQAIQRWVLQENIICPHNIGIYRIRKNNELNNIIKNNEIICHNIENYEANSKQEALKIGKSKHEWTIILEHNHIISKYAMTTIIDWISKEKNKKSPRMHLSIPVYEIFEKDFNQELLEPNFSQKIEMKECKNTVNSIVIGFHKNSKENYDEKIFSRLGHKSKKEGYGLISLWHDKYTDIVGGIFKIN